MRVARDSAPLLYPPPLFRAITLNSLDSVERAVGWRPRECRQGRLKTQGVIFFRSDILHRRKKRRSTSSDLYFATTSRDDKTAGFVTREDGGGDFFVHQSDIHAEGFRSLRDQEPVEFELEEVLDGTSRYKAVKVGVPDDGGKKEIKNMGRGTGGSA